MAGGFAVSPKAGVNAADYHSKLNAHVILVSLIAASGGLLFGYDIGVTGGVESMASFQQKFFPEVYARTELGAQNTNPYCTYNDWQLQLFTSSLFLAGLVISFPASYITRKYGRKVTMVFAGINFLAGASINAGAQDLAMLIIGRILLGFGIGSANAVVPLYLSEMAPHNLRGSMNICFQLMVTIGILTAQLINYGLQDLEWGWRLSLGLAAVPATILLLGGLLLPESPNSLVERGYDVKGRAVLEKLRGTSQVDAEYEDIKEAVEFSNRVSFAASWKAMLTRAYLPMFIVTITLAIAQQLSGINSIMFYVPVIFNSLGSGRSAALLNTVIIGAVNVLATFVSIYFVDRSGRRSLYIEGGIQMSVALIITGAVLGVEFNKYTSANLPSEVAIGVLVVICVFVAGFAWSHGPLAWLVGSEIQTLETRAAGNSANVAVNFLFSFIIGQAFLSMLCAMKWGVFLFFAGWVVLATIFIYFCLPETKGVPVERMQLLFARHPVWGKVMGPAKADILSRDASRTASRKALAAANGNGSSTGSDHSDSPRVVTVEEVKK